MILSVYQTNKKAFFPEDSFEENDFVRYHKNRNARAITDTTSNEKCQNETLNRLIWIKKKYSQFQELNQLTPINSLNKYNIKSPFSSKYLHKNKQKNPLGQFQHLQLIQKQKRFNSQADFIEQKKRKSHQIKFLNQTLIDKQHNFIGKNYFKQIQCLKQNFSNISESSKKFLPVKKNSINQNSKNESFILASLVTQQKKPLNHISSNKNYSLLLKKDLFLNQQQLSGFTDAQNVKSQKKYEMQCLNQKLKKQMIKNVENEIKIQMKRFKKAKLNKFRFKEAISFKKEQINKKIVIPSRRKSLSLKNSPQKLQTLPKQNNFNKLNTKIQSSQNQKKSYSAFDLYQGRLQKSKVLTFPTIQQLVPWQNDHCQHCDL